MLLPIAFVIGGIAIFNAMFEAVWLLYVNKTLGLEPVTFGIMFSMGGVGLLLSALAADRVIARVGVGRAIVIGVMIVGLSDLATPMAGGPGCRHNNYPHGCELPLQHGSHSLWHRSRQPQTGSNTYPIPGTHERCHKLAGDRSRSHRRPDRRRAWPDYWHARDPVPGCRWGNRRGPLGTVLPCMVAARPTGAQRLLSAIRRFRVIDVVGDARLRLQHVAALGGTREPPGLRRRWRRRHDARRVEAS